MVHQNRHLYEHQGPKVPIHNRSLPEATEQGPRRDPAQVGDVCGNFNPRSRSADRVGVWEWGPTAGGRRARLGGDLGAKFRGSCAYGCMSSSDEHGCCLARGPGSAESLAGLANLVGLTAPARGHVVLSMMDLRAKVQWRHAIASSPNLVARASASFPHPMSAKVRKAPINLTGPCLQIGSGQGPLGNHDQELNSHWI